MNHLVLTHVLFITAAFITFSVSFLAGLLFLFYEARLKNHRPIPSWAGFAPSLEVMDGLHYKILTAGFVLLSVGMLIGAVLSKQLEGAFLTGDPRKIASLITWGIYALFLNVRIRAGWRGRRGILLSLLGFATVALTYFAINHRVI